MKISSLKILELNKEHNLIENLSERELNNPEGAGIDLRVGEVYEISSDSFLASDDSSRERYSPKIKLIGDFSKDENKIITLEPGQYFLVTTMEVICSPDKKIKFHENFPEAYLKPIIYPRSSLQRGGISLHFTKTDPGYKGKLTFGLKNLGEHDFRFELGARMFNIEFEPVFGEIKRAYSGQHQGGRVTSDGKREIQN